MMSLDIGDKVQCYNKGIVGVDLYEIFTVINIHSGNYELQSNWNGTILFVAWINMPLHFHIYYKARFSTPLSQQTSTGAGITLPSGWIIDTPPSNIDLSTGKRIGSPIDFIEHKCDCGAEKTYGKNIDDYSHSTWCSIIKNKRRNHE